MILRASLLIFITVVYSQECYDGRNQFCVDQNDILSADLLPGSFIFMDEYDAAENMSRSNEEDILFDGSFVKAFDEMEYHRKRMNEYLCHGYVAEEIFKEVGSVRIKRKNDFIPPNSIIDIPEEPNVTVHDKLLSDEGSLKYKNWLYRTTTLDDVYRHYTPKLLTSRHEVYEEPESTEGEIAEFEGELTGYTMPGNAPSVKVGAPRGDLLHSPTSIGVSRYATPIHEPPPMIPHYHDFVPTVHEQHIYLPSHDEEEEDEDYDHYPVYHGKGKGHDLSIKDFFEIALTGLAFLAFGLFVIQLLMNCTMTTTTASTTTGTANLIADIDQRFKRHILDSRSLGYNGGSSEVNELAHRVLRSIEAALIAEADSGNCLRRLLCEDNRFSRDTEGGRRIWIPLWSVGMSWVSGRLLQRDRWAVVQESIKAAVLGLGRAECETLYPNCQLWRERVKRRRRKRK